MKLFGKFCLVLIVPAVFVIQGCGDVDSVDEEKFEFPSKVINRITVDETGTKWFATDKGIISFDGEVWKSYTNDQNKTKGSVTDIVFDHLPGVKKLWLATNAGLSALEFNAGNITSANFSTEKSDILSDTVSAVNVDGKAIKYIGTSKGLSILKDGKWDKFYGRSGEEILAEYRINSLAVTDNGYIYAATGGGGISRFKYTDAISGATTFNLPWAGGLPSENVLCAVADGIAQWYGTDSGAAHHASEFAKAGWTTYTRADGLICDTVYSIAKDQAGNVWFGTHKGVSKLTGNKWQSYTVKNGLIADKIKTIAVDLDQSLWFGSDKGITHYTSDGKWVNY